MSSYEAGKLTAVICHATCVLLKAKLSDTNFIVGGRFWSHAVRDGTLITGQQQYSGAAAARLVIEALGV